MLEIKSREKCAYDEISLGEVMLRLDPGHSRIKTARSFQAWEGGGEYNVARGLRRCFGLKTAVITALADNDVGRLIEDFILQGGVDTSFINWLPFDGVGRSVRNGLNFTERGFGVRGALGVSDRGMSAASQMKPEDIDFEHIFGTLGVRWFHTGGIFSALSDSSAMTAVKAAKAAKKHGTVVSYDLNYRPSLWKDAGGLQKAREVNRELAKYVDVVFGNEEDFTACLGFEIRGNCSDLKELHIDGYREMLAEVSVEFPNIKIAAATLRTVKSASLNGWSALCCAGGKVYKGIDFPELEVYDRVGGGDSFASGFIYGLMSGGCPQTAVNYGVAHGALAMTTPGDTSMASKKEVDSLLSGVCARVQR